MMKRNILAVIVPALLVAGTVKLSVCIISPRVTVKTVTVAMAT